MIAWFTESASTALIKARQKLSGLVRGLKTQVTTGTGISSTFTENAIGVILALLLFGFWCLIEFSDFYYAVPMIVTGFLGNFVAEVSENGYK